MSKSSRNATLRRLFAKAGFSLENTADLQLGSVIVAEHRFLCGHQLKDAGSYLQVGTAPAGSEWSQAATDAIVRAPAFLVELAKGFDGNGLVYVVGPNARWIAKGYGFHLVKLVELAQEHNAQVRAKAAEVPA